MKGAFGYNKPMDGFPMSTWWVRGTEVLHRRSYLRRREKRVEVPPGTVEVTDGEPVLLEVTDERCLCLRLGLCGAPHIGVV